MTFWTIFLASYTTAYFASLLLEGPISRFVDGQNVEPMPIWVKSILLLFWPIMIVSLFLDGDKFRIGAVLMGVPTVAIFVATFWILSA